MAKIILPNANVPFISTVEEKDGTLRKIDSVWFKSLLGLVDAVNNGTSGGGGGGGGGGSGAFTDTVTINPPAGHKGFLVGQNGPTTAQTGPFIYNEIDVNDDAPASGDTRTMGLYMQYNTGGPNGLGGKYGAFFNLNHNVASATGGDHIALVSATTSTVSDISGGELYGQNGACYALSGCSTPGLNGMEIDIRIDTGATVARRCGVRIINEGNSVASGIDCAYAIMSTTAGGGFKTGLLLSTHFGQPGLESGSDVIGLDGAHTVANFAACASLTVTNEIFRFPGLIVKGTGATSIGGGAINTGVILAVSNNAANLPAVAAGPVQIGKADGSPCIMTLDSFGTGTFTAFSEVEFRRANGTAAAPSALQNNDLIALFGGSGYGATGYSSIPRAQLRFSATENWTNAAQGERVVVLTTPTGTVATAVAAAFEPSGALTVGAVADPGIGNVAALNGFYVGTNPVIGPRITGYTAFTGTNTNRATAYDTATITLVQLAERVRALQVDLTAHGVIGA